MKTFKESLLENGHLFIIWVTLAVTCATFSVKATHSAPDDIHAAYLSYGYESASTEEYALAMAADERVLTPRELQNFNHVRDYSSTLAGMQYAAEAAQEVFDPYGLQSSFAGSNVASKKASYGQVLVGMQYAAESGDVLDAYGLQFTQLSDSREKAGKAVPLS